MSKKRRSNIGSTLAVVKMTMLELSLDGREVEHG